MSMHMEQESGCVTCDRRVTSYVYILPCPFCVVAGVQVMGTFLYEKPDYQASTMVIRESDEVMAGDGVVIGTDGHCRWHQ